MSRLLSNKFGLLIALTILLGSVEALPEYSADTGEPCVVCHPQTLRERGPAGEYYKEHGTLEGYGKLPEEEREVLGGVCTACHAQMEPNFTPRELVAGPTSPNHRFELNHSKRFWCLTCHDPVNRDRLRLINGTRVEFEESIQICAQCHAVVYADWQKHIHGKWVGQWKEAEPQKICVDCHNPHDPDFEKLVPEPAPKDPPESVPFENYNLYSALVLIVAAALAALAAWK